MYGFGLLVVRFVGGAFAKEAAQNDIVQKTVADLEWRTSTPGVPLVSSKDWKGPAGSHCTSNRFPKA